MIKCALFINSDFTNQKSLYSYLQAFALLSLMLLTNFVKAQELKVITQLPDNLKESSGLLHLENRLFTHNDSGDQPYIYELNKDDGTVINTIEVRGASNIDWEDITYDDSHIFIADMGNNNGNRQDLKIYKISRSEFLNASNQKVDAEKINIKYKDQTDYSSNPYDTNFDAEAIIALENQLLVFTKNWMNYETDIYTLPKTVGNYELEKLGSINSEGLITASTYNKTNNQIILTGYDEDYSFVTVLKNFNLNDLSVIEINRQNLQVPAGTSFQVEAIDIKENGEFYLTSEASYSGNATLFSYKIENTLSVLKFDKVTDSIFPNPASTHINLKVKNFQFAEIFNINGKKVLHSNRKKILLNNLSKGIYLIKSTSYEGEKVNNFKLIIER